MSLHVVLTSDFSTKSGNYFVLQYQLHLKIGMVLTNTYPGLSKNTPTLSQYNHNYLVGVSLSEPHTSGTALQRYICMSVGLLAAIYHRF